MIFLDSSLLVRRYGSSRRSTSPTSASKGDPNRYCISDLSSVEFRSAMWRRVREQAIDLASAEAAIAAFTEDLPSFYRVPVDEGILRSAEALVKQRPLHSLDAIQLATAIRISKEFAGPFRFGSVDKRLNAAAEAEGLELLGIL